ncbi:MAG: DUF4185 domain-containing protein [Micropruina sp.]|uniref:DUF4185 domain-containing protein n=1 Tax=Micropruina sp. TaxID=2737536 RepID=UPI0039E5CA8B
MATTRPALIGPESLLESDDRPSAWTPPGAPHRLEAAVGSRNDDGTLTVHHYFSGQRRPDNPWLRGDAISTAALGPAALHQRGRPGSAGHELLAYLPEADGLICYAWAVNDPRPLRWRRLGPVDRTPPGPRRPVWDGPSAAREWGTGVVIAVATAATRLRGGLAQPGWVQALVQVDDSIYHLHRQVRAGGVRWLRHACLRLADHEPVLDARERSAKVAQISGERDTQPSGSGRTLSSSESLSGVRGTDLGVRFDHAGRTFLLFGDTHWSGRPWLGTRDAIAEVRNPDAALPEVRFHGSPLSLRGGLGGRVGRVTMREYDVPLDAFSAGAQLYGFFTSNHFRHAQPMGRSVLARATPPVPVIAPQQRHRPVRFRPLATFSDHRFVNVSVQRCGDHLLIWGTGVYRADDVRLARVDLTAPAVSAGLAGGDVRAFLDAREYWAGPGAWSPVDSDALPVLSPGAHGELSVRWVPEVGRYLMLAMAGPDDPAGPAVILRTAVQPWGPWSPRLRLLNWIADGMHPPDAAQRFIRAFADGTDPVGDAVFRQQANSTGAAYAPYIFDTRADGDRLVLRYTLSTWNPYQVVLMRHRLSLAELVGAGSAGMASQRP